MNINSVLIGPVLTEKATILSKQQVFTFYVNHDAKKSQIKEVVEKLYKVKVSGIRIMVRKGKLKRVGRKGKSKKMADTKLAFVELKEGKIELFPQT
ncbi:MAG: 50S ribosomal protein L23 [bacterium]|nr:50S ribosomal protein L23 [bacterium]